ncbi:MAG: hypothetical protein [Caudoviricetes sp.]|nr:MAG: hypothetical protein [Caudoviricetes sp.]
MSPIEVEEPCKIQGIDYQGDLKDHSLMSGSVIPRKCEKLG